MNDDRETKRMYCELLEADLSIDLEKDLSPPPVAITFGTHEYKTSKGTIIEETPMATYGNFSFIQAPPKSYKSYFVSLLASVYLKSENKWASEKFKSYSNGKRLLQLLFIAIMVRTNLLGILVHSVRRRQRHKSH
jgi:hypothetical protein